MNKLETADRAELFGNSENEPEVVCSVDITQIDNLEIMNFNYFINL